MTTVRLAVDWTRCAGHGLCRELLPDAVDLDPWGYPVLNAVPDVAAARRAVAACPALALRLERPPRP